MPTLSPLPDPGHTFETLKYVNRDLPVALTPAEYVERGKRLAELQQEQIALEEEARGIASDYRARIKGLRGQQAQMTTALVDGQEPRTVTCRIEGCYASNEVRIIREDTGAVLESRAMEPGERQATLFKQLNGPDVDLPPEYDDALNEELKAFGFARPSDDSDGDDDLDDDLLDNADAH